VPDSNQDKNNNSINIFINTFSFEIQANKEIGAKKSIFELRNTKPIYIINVYKNLSIKLWRYHERN
jgi:hypothetical protein